jgi:hypothetical protein
LAIEENEEEFLAKSYHKVSLEKLQELIHDINTSKCKRHDHRQEFEDGPKKVEIHILNEPIVFDPT